MNPNTRINIAQDQYRIERDSASKEKFTLILKGANLSEIEAGYLLDVFNQVGYDIEVVEDDSLSAINPPLKELRVTILREKTETPADALQRLSFIANKVKNIEPDFEINIEPAVNPINISVARTPLPERDRNLGQRAQESITGSKEENDFIFKLQEIFNQTNAAGNTNLSEFSDLFLDTEGKDISHTSFLKVLIKLGYRQETYIQNQYIPDETQSAIRNNNAKKLLDLIQKLNFAIKKVDDQMVDVVRRLIRLSYRLYVNAKIDELLSQCADSSGNINLNKFDQNKFEDIFNNLYKVSENSRGFLVSIVEDLVIYNQNSIPPYHNFEDKKADLLKFLITPAGNSPIERGKFTSEDTNELLDIIITSSNHEEIERKKHELTVILGIEELEVEKLQAIIGLLKLLKPFGLNLREIHEIIYGNSLEIQDLDLIIAKVKDDIKGKIDKYLSESKDNQANSIIRGEVTAFLEWIFENTDTTNELRYDFINWIYDQEFNLKKPIQAKEWIETLHRSYPRMPHLDSGLQDDQDVFKEFQKYKVEYLINKVKGISVTAPNIDNRITQGLNKKLKIKGGNSDIIVEPPLGHMPQVIEMYAENRSLFQANFSDIYKDVVNIKAILKYFKANDILQNLLVTANEETVRNMTLVIASTTHPRLRHYFDSLLEKFRNILPDSIKTDATPNVANRAAGIMASTFLMDLLKVDAQRDLLAQVSNNPFISYYTATTEKTKKIVQETTNQKGELRLNKVRPQDRVQLTIESDILEAQKEWLNEIKRNPNTLGTTETKNRLVESFNEKLTRLHDISTLDRVDPKPNFEDIEKEVRAILDELFDENGDLSLDHIDRILRTLNQKIQNIYLVIGQKEDLYNLQFKPELEFNIRKLEDVKKKNKVITDKLEEKINSGQFEINEPHMIESSFTNLMNNYRNALTDLSNDLKDPSLPYIAIQRFIKWADLNLDEHSPNLAKFVSEKLKEMGRKFNSGTFKKIQAYILLMKDQEFRELTSDEHDHLFNIMSNLNEYSFPQAGNDRDAELELGKKVLKADLKRILRLEKEISNISPDQLNDINNRNENFRKNRIRRILNESLHISLVGGLTAAATIPAFMVAGPVGVGAVATIGLTQAVAQPAIGVMERKRVEKIQQARESIARGSEFSQFMNQSIIEAKKLTNEDLQKVKDRLETIKKNYEKLTSRGLKFWRRSEDEIKLTYPESYSKMVQIMNRIVDMQNTINEGNVDEVKNQIDSQKILMRELVLRFALEVGNLAKNKNNAKSQQEIVNIINEINQGKIL